MMPGKMQLVLLASALIAGAALPVDWLGARVRLAVRPRSPASADSHTAHAPPPSPPQEAAHDGEESMPTPGPSTNPSGRTFDWFAERKGSGTSSIAWSGEYRAARRAQPGSATDELFDRIRQQLGEEQANLRHLRAEYVPEQERTEFPRYESRPWTNTAFQVFGLLDPEVHMMQIGNDFTLPASTQSSLSWYAPSAATASESQRRKLASVLERFEVERRRLVGQIWLRLRALGSQQREVVGPARAYLVKENEMWVVTEGEDAAIDEVVRKLRMLNSEFLNRAETIVKEGR
jgi:hypothetical protein